MPQDTDTNLSALIRKVARIEGIKHIRLSSIEPTAFGSALMQTFAEEEKLCPHFHISLQSGSDSVLKRMNRRYTTEQYAAVVSGLRDVRPDVAVTTDVIAGFPGETDAEFDETRKFVQKIGLSGIHVFPYSERPGTAAAKMKEQIPRPVRESRAKQLIETAFSLRHAFVQKFVGSVQPVLFEHKNGELSGFTPHFVRVVVPDPMQNAADPVGKIVPVYVTSVEGEILYGKL